MRVVRIDRKVDRESMERIREVKRKMRKVDWEEME